MLHAAPSAWLELIRAAKSLLEKLRTSRRLGGDSGSKAQLGKGSRGPGTGERVEGGPGPQRSPASEAGEERVLPAARPLGWAERGAPGRRRRYLGREGEDHRQQRERREQQHQQPPRAPHLLGHCRQRCHLRDRPAERAGPGLPAPGPPRRLKAWGRVRGGDCARGPPSPSSSPRKRVVPAPPGLGRKKRAGKVRER